MLGKSSAQESSLKIQIVNFSFYFQASYFYFYFFTFKSMETDLGCLTDGPDLMQVHKSSEGGNYLPKLESNSC